MSNLKYLNDQNFDENVANGVCLIDFFADWCGPCKMITPIVEELSSEYQGKVLIAKVDVDNAQSVSSKYGITSIPTVIVLKNGKEINRIVGVRDKATFKRMIDAAL